MRPDKGGVKVTDEERMKRMRKMERSIQTLGWRSAIRRHCKIRCRRRPSGMP